MAFDILVVDDESDIRELISDILTDEGYTARLASDSCTAIAAIEERVPAAVILDIWLQGSEMDGLGILEWIKQRYPAVPVIMISGHGTIDTAIASIRLGAYDYLEKPFKEEKLLRLVNRAIETVKLKDENAQLKARGAVEQDFIGDSVAITNVRQTIRKIAATSSRVLITGRPGSGKEIVARLIHQKSKRAAAPFVILNTAQLSEETADAELFGVDAANGNESKQGVFERAHGGTLYIDEIADLSADVQLKLLRLLQTDSFERSGSGKKVSVDVRVIAASCRNLEAEIAAGRVREDLYYRLNVAPVHMPSLVERKGDLIPLAEYFVKRCAAQLGVAPRVISEDAYVAMQSYDWPGNVRQLRNVIEWMLIMAPEDVNAPVTANMLPPDVLNENPAMLRPEVNADIMSLPLRQARELFEKQYLAAQLQRFGGNISKTATFIGMERSAFHRKIKTLNIHNQEESVEA